MNLIKNDFLFENGNRILNESIKIALYKQDKNIFEVLDFENDKLYQEPLLFAYFNEKQIEKQSLDSIVCGYTEKIQKVKLTTDEHGRIYVPNKGWFLTALKHEQLTFHKKKIKLLKDKTVIPYHFEPIQLIRGTHIEILKYSIPLLKQFYFSVDNKLLDVEIENISKIQLENITKGYNLIKKFLPNQFELIEKLANKCVIFKLDTYQRNSFATLSAHGITFFNAFQIGYDEVFFVDDIARQTGRVIMNNLLVDVDNFFKIDRNTILEVINISDSKFIENRSLNIIYNALYMHYCSFICLDACLHNEAFQGKQKHEAFGRISFYIKKCKRELLILNKPSILVQKSNQYFNKDGMAIYLEIINKLIEIDEKWHDTVKDFDLSNQPYNFSYSKFVELNPIF